MGRQASILKLFGTVQGVTFYKSADGYMARAKSSLTRKRVKTEAAFEASRQASKEFGRAGAGARMLRDAFWTTGRRMGDSRILARLTGKLVGLMATDTVRGKGDRLVEACDLDQLKGFEWNKATAMDMLLHNPVAISIDAATGVITASVPELQHETDIKLPANATHYEIVMGGAAIDFAKDKFSMVEDSTGWVPINGSSAAVVLSGTLADFADRWLFAGVGIHFGIETNGKVDPLADRKTMGFVMG